MMNIKEDVAVLDAKYLLERLKDETKPIHEHVEQKNLARFIVDHSITKEQYCALISYNYQVYHSLESYLLKHKDLLPSTLQELLNFDKSNALSKDLASCKIEKSHATFRLKENPEKMDLIGVMYVMEGSMLGGLVIANHITACPHLEDLDEFHFFSKDAKSNMQRWKRFKNALEAEKYSEFQINRAVETAKEVFTYFEIFEQS